MASFVFKMPDIGEGIVETEVVEWHIAPGDEVAEDAPLADVMTDKATVEITAPVAGKIMRIGCAAGEKMVIGADFVEFDTAVASDAPLADSEPPSTVAGVSADAAAPATVMTAETAQTANDTTVAGQHTASVSETSATVATAKEKPAAVAGVSVSRDLDTPSLPPAKPKIRVVSDGDSVSEVKVAVTQTAAANAVVAPKLTPEEPATSAKSQEAVSTASRDIVPASPVVRRLARDLGLELADIAGSGPAGRVTKDDIRRLIKPAASANARTSKHFDSSSMAVNSGLAATTGVKAGANAGVNKPGISGTPDAGNASQLNPGQAAASSREVGAIEAVPVKGLRRLIAQRMQESKREIPHFSYVEEVRVDQLEDLRRQLNADRQESMPKISLLHLLLLGVSRVVKHWPQCNANFDDESETLNQFERVHLGVATMTSNGLMVPVVANACQLGLWDIANEVNRLAEAARNSSLSRDELTGGTLTVTSLGALAGVVTTPVINRPETSIIGPNKMMKRVEIRNGVATEIRVMNISSSFDHRVVDGYDAAMFLSRN